MAEKRSKQVAVDAATLRKAVKQQIESSMAMHACAYVLCLLCLCINPLA
jgi:hypothetical protein